MTSVSPKRTTIFALSTGPAPAGVAIVRVSGPEAFHAAERLAPPLPAPRRAVLRTLLSPSHPHGTPIDRGLVLCFPGPASFTGEDVVEFHTHGSRAVIAALLDTLGRIDGLRLAEPGEFTRRAFEAGKLDLTQAEGLADLIAAETEAQRRQALAQTAGAQRDTYEHWRADLIRALALVESGLDFTDEADIPEDLMIGARAIAAGLAAAIAAHLDDGRRGEILRQGFEVVLAGPPNVGKSSLFNKLARRDAAIVSEEAGTTRDTIELRMDLEGLPVTVIDTAGLGKARGAIEAEGIRRTRDRMARADLIIWLSDATNPDPTPPPQVSPPDSPSDSPPEPPDGTNETPILQVRNKIDLVDGAALITPTPPRRQLLISARTGTGIDRLAARIAAIARDRFGTGEMALVTRARHRAGLERCTEALAHFLAGDPSQTELRAEELRIAAMALGRITGRIDVEDVLERIFADFCIGK